MDTRSKSLAVTRRLRIVAVLAAAGAIQAALTYLGSATGLLKPQWLVLPLGVGLWSLAFWYSFRLPVQGPDTGLGEP